MELLKVKGIELPTPAKDGIQYTEQDLSQNDYRDGKGYLHKKTVRWGVRRLDVSWDNLSSEEIRLIRSLTKGNEYFTLEYYSDALDHKGVINECYSSDYKYTLRTVTKNGKSARYSSVTLAFVER